MAEWAVGKYGRLAAAVCGGYGSACAGAAVAAGAAVLDPPRLFRIAYLGTAAHQQELAWLLALFRQLQQRRADCLLELVVDAAGASFSGLPRARLLYPMDWETFSLDTGNRSVDLMLVPLLEAPSMPAVLP